MANLTYECGSARMFLDSETDDHIKSLSMSCQWNEEWTGSAAIPELLPCDWIACLQPPTPPSWTNLRHTGWFGDPIPFNGWVRFVCERGTFFEFDPELEYVDYQCQDGNEEGTERGYFKIPDEADWPICLSSPLCPPPPGPRCG